MLLFEGKYNENDNFQSLGKERILKILEIYKEKYQNNIISNKKVIDDCIEDFKKHDIDKHIGSISEEIKNTFGITLDYNMMFYLDAENRKLNGNKTQLIELSAKIGLFKLFLEIYNTMMKEYIKEDIQCKKIKF